MNFSDIIINSTGIAQDYIYYGGDPAVLVESCKIQCYAQMNYLYFIPLFITISGYIILFLINTGIIKRRIKISETKYEIKYLDMFDLLQVLFLIFSIIILLCLYFKIF